MGNARTALLNYLAARKTGGRFILRVEDTDEGRSTDAFMEALFEDLRWLGLEWNEGPDVGGPHAPYRQQQRKDLYEEWLVKLDAAGLTYPCFCTPAELSIGRKRMLHQIDLTLKLSYFLALSYFGTNPCRRIKGRNSHAGHLYAGG